MSPFQPDELFRRLDRHGVRYVLIGGMAAVLQGSPLPTLDVDICPDRARDNLERLAAALVEVGARIRTPDVAEGLAFSCDAAFLERVQILNLVTAVGDVDITFVPSGTLGYAELASKAVTITIQAVHVAVACVEDIIRSKEAADRPKDRLALPTLRLLQEEIRRRRGEP